MIKILKSFFDNKDVDKNKTDISNLELLSGLMIEAANSDGIVDQTEIDKISLILTDTFQEDQKEVKLTLDKAITNKNNSKSLYYYTSKINKNYSDRDKILLLETLWQIILSDGEVHDYESSLIRRLSGLLYISDIDANARKKHR